MRFVANKRELPRCWVSHPKAAGVVAEADIFVHGNGRLAAKLLVFDSVTSLCRFWRNVVGHSLGHGCRGAVNALAQTRESVGRNPKPPTLHGDPRYFCVIGLVVGHLTMEIIAHESVHAGFCYEKRVRRNLFGAAADFDEERIAYPAGRIAGAVNRFIHDKGLYNMPYKSKAQQRKFHAMAARGEIPKSTVKKFDEATKKKKGGFSKLPARKGGKKR